MTDGKRNKEAGTNFEKEVVAKLNKAGFNVTTALSRGARDKSKVDIVREDEGLFGRLPYNLQCKALAKHADYCKLLAEMPDSGDVNVLLHRKTKKIESGEFINQGTYAILNAEDFYELIQELQFYKAQ